MNLFGVVPLENAVVMNKKYAPLIAYLNNKLGMDYIIKAGKDYTEAIEDVGTGRVQISSQTPTTLQKTALPLTKVLLWSQKTAV